MASTRTAFCCARRVLPSLRTLRAVLYARPLGSGLDRCQPGFLANAEIEMLRSRYESHGRPCVPLLGSPGRRGAPRAARTGGQHRPAAPAASPRRVAQPLAPAPPQARARRGRAVPEHGGDAARWCEARQRGEARLRAGRVAAMVVAGGQATRLGYDGPRDSSRSPGHAAFALRAPSPEAARTARRYGRPCPGT